jgi:hypothetical protein
MSAILLILCFFQMVPYSQAGPIDWADKKAGEYIEIKSGVKEIKKDLAETKEKLKRAEQDRDSTKSTLWTIIFVVIAFIVLIIVSKAAWRKAHHNRR